VSEPQQGHARPRARIESLADLIFGLALSVGAISLVSSPPTTVAAVYSDLETFGFSFFILITMWVRYTRIMSVFPLESRRVVNLNIMLLFCVSIEPFLFNLVSKPPVNPATDAAYAAYVGLTSALYALDLGAMFAILGGFTLTLASDERKLLPKELTTQYRIEGVIWFAAGLVFGISALPIFFTTVIPGHLPLRYYLWIVPIGLLYIGRAAQKRFGGPEV
jgi:uncharacterized membrane protein